MALTKDKKAQVIAELQTLFADSKMTVVANYQGVTVKSLQQLRREAKANGTVIKVVKNRLVIKAITNSDTLKSADTSALKDMLLYAFNAEDEVASAQVLKNFMKNESSMQFVGAITSDGQFMSSEDVTALASLPGKNQLIAGLINTLNAPVRGVVGSLSGNLHGLLQAIEAKATN
jgi:large subunit ribosomal protein L10